MRRVLRRDRLQIAQRRQPGECLAFELSHALASQVELVTDGFERPGLALESKTQLEDSPLTLGQGIQRLADTLPAKRFLGLVEWIGSLPISEEVAQLALVVRPHRLIEGDRGMRCAESLVDVL